MIRRVDVRYHTYTYPPDVSRSIQTKGGEEEKDVYYSKLSYSTIQLPTKINKQNKQTNIKEEGRKKKSSYNMFFFVYVT